MTDYLETADVWTILDLIVAEFQSDPMSVQCFDARVVKRAIALNRAHRDAPGVAVPPSGDVRTQADWGAFLRERHLLILEWTAEGQSFERIARSLSMDPMQVQLISMTPEKSTRAHVAPRSTKDPHP